MSVQKYLTEIYETGMNDYVVAARIGVKQPIINRLRNGVNKSTSYERGLKIKELAVELRPDIYG